MQQWHSLIYLNTLYCIISIFKNLPQQVQPHSISKISIIFQIGAKSNVSIKTVLFHLLFRGRIMCLGAITLWSLQEALGSCRRWLLHIYQSGTSLSSREREVNTHTHTHPQIYNSYSRTVERNTNPLLFYPLTSETLYKHNIHPLHSLLQCPEFISILEIWLIW